jgi:Domain of unknown function (DUF4249)
MKNPAIIFAIIALTTVSCVSQFTPEIVSQSRFLTVNGLITDENRQYTIKLGLSKPLDVTSDEEPAKGALVRVSDNLDNSWVFREKEPGFYVSDSTLFTGQPGRTYTLSISYKGILYESSPCLLRISPPIDEVGYEVIDREINASGETEKIVRVMLNTIDPSSDNHFYRWTYDETWEIHLPFNNIPYENRICWMSEQSHNIVVANTEALSEDRITDLTVTTFNNSTDRGQFKYSILIKQYATSREEYEFWNNVKTLTENTGGLYDVTPVSVQGNINCTTDPEEIVLGLFSVSGVTTSRIFLRRPLVVNDMYKEKCVEEVIYADPGFPGLGTIYFILNIYEDDLMPDVWELTSNTACLDCASFASNVKPDYWDEGFSK